MLYTARYCYDKVVRLSVTLRYRDHIGWKSSKIISRLDRSNDTISGSIIWFPCDSRAFLFNSAVCVEWCNYVNSYRLSIQHRRSDCCTVLWLCREQCCLSYAFVLGFNLQTYSGQTTLKARFVARAARFVARAAVTLAVCYWPWFCLQWIVSTAE